MIEQLTFIPLTLEDRLKLLEEKHEKTRRSQYARIGELTKKCDEYQYEIETLKSALSRCGLTIGLKQNVTFFTIEGK